jgi:hypothetical protein
MLGLSEEMLNRYLNKIIEKTNHSERQVKVFFNFLQNKMAELEITSLDDLLVRYKIISKYSASDREEFYRAIVGLYHSYNFKTLMNILEKEEDTKAHINYLSTKIEEEMKKRISLEVSSKEYQESLEAELDYLKGKQYCIDLLK